MAKSVMCLQNKRAAFLRMDDDKLVKLRGTLTPKLAIVHKKPTCLFEKILECGFIQVIRFAGCVKEALNSW